MSKEFQHIPGQIKWHLHLTSSKEKVFDALSTDKGRATFWAERTEEKDGEVTFHYLNYPKEFTGKILEHQPPERYAIEYFASNATFELQDDGSGGTDLTLTARDVDEEWRMQMASGWVTVLMALKAAVDFGVDLRNHDPQRTWDQGFVND